MKKKLIQSFSGLFFFLFHLLTVTLYLLKGSTHRLIHLPLDWLSIDDEN